MEHIIEFLRSMDEPEMADEVANAHNRLECYSTGITNDIIESLRSVAEKSLAGLKEENESLKLDAARYQWLKSQEPSKHDGYAIGYFDTCGVDAWRMTTKDLDQAIDAAMIAGDKNVLD